MGDETKTRRKMRLWPRRAKKQPLDTPPRWRVNVMPRSEKEQEDHMNNNNNDDSLESSSPRTSSPPKPSVSKKKPVPILRREPSPALFKKLPPSTPQQAILPSSDPMVRMWMVAQGMIIFSPRPANNKVDKKGEDDTLGTSSTTGSNSTLSAERMKTARSSTTSTWASKLGCISGCHEDLTQSVSSFREIPQYACGGQGLLEEAYSMDSSLLDDDEEDDAWIDQDIQVLKTKTPKRTSSSNKNPLVIIQGDDKDVHGMSSRNCMRPLHRRVRFEEQEPPKQTARQPTPTRDMLSHGDDVSEVTNFSADSWGRYNQPTKFPNAIRIDDDDDDDEETADEESTHYSRDLLPEEIDDDPVDNFVQEQKSFWDPLF